jgi:phosphatidate cytidylyltransferase
MALHWPTFFTRLGSAIVFCAIMMAGLLWRVEAFLLLTALIQFLCLRDYFRLMQKIDPEVYWAIWLPAFVQTFSFLLLFLLGKQNAFFPVLLFAPVLLILIATLSKKTAWHSAIQSLGGFFYIALPMMLFMSLRLQSIIIPLALILMLWTNDTMAYLVGSFIGKRPFSEISPKKTWEGTIGGAVLTIVGAAIWGHYSHYYRMQDWIVLALCACVAGTAGDLLESKLKRMANVKDSGTMMPGHGGALDRFDSLLVATPFAFVYVYIFMPPLYLVIF